MRRSKRLAALATLLLVLAVPTARGQQQPQSLPTRHLHAPVRYRQLTPTATLPSSQRLKLEMMLQLRDEPGLDSFLQGLYDPSSPDYRRFLTVDQFTDRFAPTAEDYAVVVAYARTNGFTVLSTTPNRMLVDVEGTVAQIEKAFQIKMALYPHPTESRSFYSPDREPTVALSTPLRHIFGLSNFSLPHSANLRRATVPARDVRTFATGTGPGGAVVGRDLRTAYYGGTALTGAGQRVGLFGVPFDINDVTRYYQNIGEPFNASVVQTVASSGQSTSCPAPCNDAEQMVDIMRAYDMAPGVSAVIEFIGNGNAGTFNLMATHTPLALQLSSSISYIPEDPTSEEPIFKEFAAQGQSFFQASGDAGAYKPTDNNGSSYYPAESVYVTPVGGTKLTTNGAGGAWQSETSWAGSGGGPSPDGTAIPSWQVGLASSSNGASTTLRNLPDVAAEADTDNYFCSAGTCQGGIGGTSLSAPLWAGFLALANQQAAASGKPPIGLIGPAVASIGKGSGYTTAFHDITTGNNSNGNGQSYNAVTGYDLVTGWGSPNGVGMINALVGTAGSTPTPTATPTLSPNAWYHIINKTSGLCMEARSSGTANGTAVQQNTCSSSNAQSWQLQSAGSGYYNIATFNNTGQVLDVTGGATADGTLIELLAKGSGTNQQFQPVAEAGGYYQFVIHSNTASCIDTPGSSTATGTQLQEWTCNPSGAQAFNLVVVGGTTPTPTPTPTATRTPTATPTATRTPTATATGGTGAGTLVNLSTAFNVNVAYTDGTTFSSTGGIDGVGSAYSSTLLGSALTWSGTTFSFGPANQANGVRNKTITLPAGQFGSLLLLGTGVNGDQASQTVTVNYTDGTSSTFTQTFSNWLNASQSVPGQSIALTTAYRNKSTGVKDNRAFNLYGYSLALTSSKTVSSLVLPANNNVSVLAVTLRAAATTPTATPTPTRTATPTATSGTGTGACAGVAAFASCTAYPNGSKVVYNNTLYHATADVPATRDCPPSSPFNPSNDNWWVNDGGC